MKKVLLLGFAIVLAVSGFAQTLTMDKVPAACSQAFKLKYPNGSQPGWRKAGADIFEVQFFNDKKRQSALFDNAGKWLQTQTEINYRQIPGKVQNTFIREFETYNVQEVYETETHDKGLCYEIIAFKGGASVVVLFSSKGEILKREEEATEQ